MTSEERAAMRARCEAATPSGRWIAPPWPWTPADLSDCLGEINRLEAENAHLWDELHASAELIDFLEFLSRQPDRTHLDNAFAAVRPVRVEAERT